MAAILEVKFQFHSSPLWVLSRKLFFQGPQFSLAHLDCKKISFPLGIHYQVSWFWLTRSPLDTSLFCDTLVGQGIRGTQEAHPSIGKQICNFLANPYPIQKGSKKPHFNPNGAKFIPFVKDEFGLEGTILQLSWQGVTGCRPPLFLFL